MSTRELIASFEESAEETYVTSDEEEEGEEQVQAPQRGQQFITYSRRAKQPPVDKQQGCKPNKKGNDDDQGPSGTSGACYHFSYDEPEEGESSESQPNLGEPSQEEETQAPFEIVLDPEYQAQQEGESSREPIMVNLDIHIPHRPGELEPTLQELSEIVRQAINQASQLVMRDREERRADVSLSQENTQNEGNEIGRPDEPYHVVHMVDPMNDLSHDKNPEENSGPENQAGGNAISRGPRSEKSEIEQSSPPEDEDDASGSGTGCHVIGVTEIDLENDEEKEKVDN